MGLWQSLKDELTAPAPLQRYLVYRCRACQEEFRVPLERGAPPTYWGYRHGYHHCGPQPGKGLADLIYVDEGHIPEGQKR